MNPLQAAALLAKQAREKLYSCEPADRLEAGKAVRTLYKLAGKPEPRTISWFLSPAAAIYSLMSKYKCLEEFESSWNGTHASLRTMVVQQIFAAARGRTACRVELGTIDYYTMLGVRKDDSAFVHAFHGVTDNCTLWWALRGEAILIDRPEYLATGPEGVLHNDSGPAVVWRDGNKDYALEGFRVPDYVVMDPSKITIEDIQGLGNKVEARRIWINRMGIRRFLAECKATTIDMDGGLPGPGGAPRALLEDCFGARWMYCTDGSTNRLYFLSVPPTAATCSEAHTAISGLDNEQRIIAEG